MHLGVTDSIWTISELVDTALHGIVTGKSIGHRVGRFLVTDGGRRGADEMERDTAFLLFSSGIAFGLAGIAQAGWKTPILIRSLFVVAGILVVASMWNFISPLVPDFHITEHNSSPAGAISRNQISGIDFWITLISLVVSGLIFVIDRFFVPIRRYRSADGANFLLDFASLTSAQYLAVIAWAYTFSHTLWLSILHTNPVIVFGALTYAAIENFSRFIRGLQFPKTT